MKIQYTIVNYLTQKKICVDKHHFWDFIHSPEYVLYQEGFKENREEMKSYWSIWNFIKNESPKNIFLIDECGNRVYFLIETVYHDSLVKSLKRNDVSDERM